MSSGYRFWRWTTQHRPHWRESKTEAAVLFTVFGVTGSSTLYFVRPCSDKLGIKGSMWEGPNSYRVISFFAITPIYSCILITLGTLAGRHRYFALMSKKLIGRFLPSTYKEKIVCPPAAAEQAAKKASSS